MRGQMREKKRENNTVLAGLAEGLLGGGIGVAPGRKCGDVQRLLVGPYDLVEGPVVLGVCGEERVSVRQAGGALPDCRRGKNRGQSTEAYRGRG